jgi:hypothetical protein
MGLNIKVIIAPIDCNPWAHFEVGLVGSTYFQKAHAKM